MNQNFKREAGNIALGIAVPGTVGSIEFLLKYVVHQSFPEFLWAPFIHTGLCALVGGIIPIAEAASDNNQDYEFTKAVSKAGAYTLMGAIAVNVMLYAGK